MHTIAIHALIAVVCVGALAAGDWLPAGVHQNFKDDQGDLGMTVIVPAAAAGGKEAPVVFIMPSYQGRIDPAPWKPWAEQRGCLVVAFSDGQDHSQGGTYLKPQLVPAMLKHFAASIAALGKRVQMDPHLRIAVTDREMSSAALAFVKAQGDNLGGVLFTRSFCPEETAIAGLQSHLATFLLVGDEDPNSEDQFRRLRALLRGAGFQPRSAYADGGKHNERIPQPLCNVAVDHLLDLAMLTHPKQSPVRRLYNQEAVIARGQALAALPDQASYDELWWLLTLPSVPGMEKQKKPMGELANRWLNAAIGVAKATEATDIAEAHEFLCVVSKRSQAKLANATHNKALLAEITRLRKDKRIKAEIAAADAYANLASVLDEDTGTAKLKLILRDLEELVAAYPATRGGKAAAKLLEKVRAALR